MQTDKGNKKIIFSKRTRVRLPEDEMQILKEFVQNDPAPYATIARNTGVRWPTVNNIIAKGYMELQTAERLKPFIEALKTFHNTTLGDE